HATDQSVYFCLTSATTIPPTHWLLFFTAPAPTAISTLSLHDALPIYPRHRCLRARSTTTARTQTTGGRPSTARRHEVPPSLDTKDRKSTRLNSSHDQISYAVFCLKKKKQLKHHRQPARSPHAAQQPQR